MGGVVSNSERECAYLHKGQSYSIFSFNMCVGVGVGVGGCGEIFAFSVSQENQNLKERFFGIAATPLFLCSGIVSVVTFQPVIG